LSKPTRAPKTIPVTTTKAAKYQMRFMRGITRARPDGSQGQAPRPVWWSRPKIRTGSCAPDPRRMTMLGTCHDSPVTVAQCTLILSRGRRSSAARSA
jgi:hypothetical protein